MKKLKLTVSPIWDEIENARLTVLKFVEDQKLNENTAYRVLMIMSELLENGIKYGQFSDQTDDLNAIITLSNESIIIEVLHPTGQSSAANLKKMDTIIQKIRSYQDPFEAYVKKLEEVAKRSLDDDESGLGLERIAHEGGAVLDFILDENGYVNVTAVIPFE